MLPTVTSERPSVAISSVPEAIHEKPQGPVTPQPSLHSNDTDFDAGTVSTFSFAPQSMPIVTSAGLVFLTVTAVAAPAISMPAAANVRVLNVCIFFLLWGCRRPSCRGLVTTMYYYNITDARTTQT